MAENAKYQKRKKLREKILPTLQLMTNDEFWDGRSPESGNGGIPTPYEKDKKYPVFECVKHGASLLFTCPVCKEVRMHALGDKFGEGDGPRFSHCAICWEQYFLREVKGKWIGGYTRGRIQKD